MNGYSKDKSNKDILYIIFSNELKKTLKRGFFSVFILGYQGSHLKLSSVYGTIFVQLVKVIAESETISIGHNKGFVLKTFVIF